MGKHRGSRKDDTGTDGGKPFSQMIPAEKGSEFDASEADPKGYAQRNFGGWDPGSKIQNQQTYGKGSSGKHGK